MVSPPLEPAQIPHRLAGQPLRAHARIGQQCVWRDKLPLDAERQIGVERGQCQGEREVRVELFEALVGAYFSNSFQSGRRFLHFAQPIGDAAAIESGERLGPIGFLRSRKGEFCGRPELPAGEGELGTRCKVRPCIGLGGNICLPLRPSKRLAGQPPVLVIAREQPSSKFRQRGVKFSGSVIPRATRWRRKARSCTSSKQRPPVKSSSRMMPRLHQSDAGVDAAAIASGAT